MGQIVDWPMNRLWDICTPFIDCELCLGGIVSMAGI